MCSACRYKHPTVGNFRYDGVSPEKQNQHDGYIYIYTHKGINCKELAHVIMTAEQSRPQRTNGATSSPSLSKSEFKGRRRPASQLRDSQEERRNAPFLSLLFKSAPPSADRTWPAHFGEAHLLASVY